MTIKINITTRKEADELAGGLDKVIDMVAETGDDSLSAVQKVLYNMWLAIERNKEDQKWM